MISPAIVRVPEDDKALREVALKAAGPILFGGPMVRGILGWDGAPFKTQTRRKPGRDWAKYAYLYVKETWQSGAAMGVCSLEDDFTLYRATDPDWEDTEGWAWRPSIFMHKHRTRLLLRLEEVRSEPLQAISLEDSQREGFESPQAFAAAWDKIYPSYWGWGVNPTVNVLTFTPLLLVDYEPPEPVYNPVYNWPERPWD